MAELEPPISPELLEKLKQMAQESKDDHADHDTCMAADATLSVAYDEDGKWRINYTLPRKAIIGIHNRQPAELARAQIRGMMADFAFRQNANQQARITALENALRHQCQRNHDYLPNGCSGCEAARKALEGR